MKREQVWEVPVDDIVHHVSCNRTGNRYIIWVDDEDSMVVYRSSRRKMMYGLEEKLDICGKKCLFVVWDEQPRLVVDGRIIGSDKDFQQEKEKRIKGMILIHWMFFAMAAILLTVVVTFFCLGWIDKTERARYAGYVIASVGIMAKALVNRRRWKRLT